MRHAAGFGGEDASVLAAAGITRKYGVEVISHSSPGGLVCMALQMITCVHDGTCSMRGIGWGRSLFVCTDHEQKKHN
jgi:hypothetical protein